MFLLLRAITLTARMCTCSTAR